MPGNTNTRVTDSLIHAETSSTITSEGVGGGLLGAKHRPTGTGKQALLLLENETTHSERGGATACPAIGVIRQDCVRKTL